MNISTISGKLEESDFLAAVFLHQRDRIRRRWIIILIVLPLLTLAFSVQIGETWQMEWGDYRRVKADGEMILLYPAHDRFHRLPRRCFADADEAEALLRLARAKIGA